MKINLLMSFLLATFVFSTHSANAKIRRVGYFGTPITGTDYAALQSAHDAANPGDTLLIFPGTYSATFSKRLVVIGYGYYVYGSGANQNVQVTQGTLSITILLKAATDSSILEGLDGLYLVPQLNSQTILKGISVEYCNFKLGYSTGGTLSNWQIIKSVYSIFYYNTDYPALYTFQNILFENNIISTSNIAFANNSGGTGVFNNNIFTTTPNFNNGGYSLYNNIFLSTTAPSNIANCIFDYNIAGNNTIPNISPNNHNQSNVNLSTLFVGYPAQGTHSNDERYSLAAGSPAISAGQGGINCGIFGGSNPYRLSGIPSIPSFYKLTAPTNMPTTNPYTITFSVRSNN